MKNRDIKKYLFDSTLFKDINDQYSELYLYTKSCNFNQVSQFIEISKPFYYSCSADELKAFLQIKNSNMNTKRNIKQFIQFYSIFRSVKLVFCTFTFDDYYLSLSYDYRRKKLIKYLKSTFLDYIGNVDYGSCNHREHYHAVCVVKNSDYIRLFKDKSDYLLNIDYSPYLMGLCHVEHVYSDCSYYISKLSNHALKFDTTFKGSKSLITTKWEFYRFKHSDIFNDCIHLGDIAFNRRLLIHDYINSDIKVIDLLRKRYCIL